MKQWNVTVLYLGHGGLRKSQLTPNLDEDLWLEIPTLSFLLQADGRNILVDSGTSERHLKMLEMLEASEVSKKHHFGGRTYLDNALNNANIAPEEIDTVIYTHLHADHAAFSYIFQNARIIIQKKEWENILNPLPIVKASRIYDLQVIPELKGTNMVLIDGDLDIADGVRIFTTPGHTPGSQSVAVNTKRGVIALVGDQFHLACIAFPQMTEIMDIHGKKHKITPAPEIYGPFYPNKLVYNYYDFYDSGYKIKAIVEKYEPSYVIGGHEPSALFAEL